MTLACDGPTSLRSCKTSIHYVDHTERALLAAQALAVPLASYRYMHDSEDVHRRLGFIIDDQPSDSFAVASDGMHVDLYGYASLLLATVQEQQEQLDQLRRRIAALEGLMGRGETPRVRDAGMS